jgi:CRISPR-associated protein Cst1
MLLVAESGEKYRDAKAPRTLVVHVLINIEEARRDDGALDGPPSSLTVYHLSNRGDTPYIELYHLPSEVVGFLRAVARAGTAQIWQAIQAAAWERRSGGIERKTADEGQRTNRRRGKKTSLSPATDVSGPELTRNFLYEDLFDLPENAAQFVRTYFLRQAYRFAREGDPRRDYALARQRDLVSWEITRLFLREVMGMEKKRIEAIRVLGDRIVQHVKDHSGGRLFQALYRANQYRVFRNLLIKASNERLRKGEPPLIGFDEFLTVFEEGEETARVDWALARDLVLIRVIEELHRAEWFEKQPDVLEAIAAAEDEALPAI